MIILYQGRRGCGKTLSMVRDAYKYYLNGVKIYSNIDVSFPHEFVDDEDILKINSYSDINNCVLLIDEIQILLDSRRSSKGRNVDFSHFVQQIRKRNIILLCTTQYVGTVDLRLRQHVDVMAKPKYHEKFKVCEVTYIDVTVVDEMDIYDAKPQSVTVVYNAEPIFSLYNTFNIVNIQEKNNEDEKPKRIRNKWKKEKED